MNLDTPIAQLNRVGKTLEKRLKRLDIAAVRDLLFHFPFRYEDYRSIRHIADLQEGEEVTIRATVELIANKRSPRKRMVITEAVVADTTGRMRIVWFGQPYIGQSIRVGDHVFFSGKAKRDMLGVTLISPSYEKEREGQGTTHTARLVPIYPVTDGITQKQLRYLLSQVIELAARIDEWVPQEIRQFAGIIPLPHAIRGIHVPADPQSFMQARRRLKFDELFLLQLKAEMLRRRRLKTTAPAIVFPEPEIRSFVASLPFALTKDQKISAWEIFQDIKKETPMNRLLQGDVGCGKTVVAGMAAYAAHVRGFQTVLMAPTEILAHQHFETLTDLFSAQGGSASGGHPLSLSLLTRSHKKEPANGKKADIVVGTHALLTNDHLFDKTGLVIVDEQHRFGVEQRKRIREKLGNCNTTPHFLSMTATPIPRSLALTLYGDLDISIIRTMPDGRRAIETRIIEPNGRAWAEHRIREEVRAGRQAFVVCPLIDANNELRSTNYEDERKTVLAEYKKLSEQIFPDLRVGYLHGKLKPKEKEETMHAFSEGKIDILVATSVVEVGVNVPNASLMLIEGAERYGLAQLHQFRGRVGRSIYASSCLLFPNDAGAAAMERLKFFEKTHDGFLLAEYDLRVRGPGEVYGKEQSGMMQLHMATLSDTELIKLARAAAHDIDFEKYPALREKVAAWEQSVHLE